jgi:hypothetical protein
MNRLQNRDHFEATLPFTQRRPAVVPLLLTAFFIRKEHLNRAVE